MNTPLETQVIEKVIQLTEDDKITWEYDPLQHSYISSRKSEQLKYFNGKFFLLVAGNSILLFDNKLVDLMDEKISLKEKESREKALENFLKEII